MDSGAAPVRPEAGAKGRASGNAGGIFAYLLMAFGGAWLLWALALRAGGTLATNPAFQILILPGAFAPAVAAIVVRRWVTREGFADAGLRPDLRRGWRYYLFGLLWPFLAVSAIVVLAVVLGLSRPDFSLQRSLGELAPGRAVPAFPAALWPLIPVQLAITAVIATPLLWGEEFGWRGYLQSRLFANQPLPAAVATGLLWGVWHYPLILAGYGYPDDRVLGLLIFPVGTVLVSVFFGWLRLRTGSVWAPSLAHAATNAVGGSLTTLLFLGGPNWVFASYLGILGWVPLGALCVWIVLTGRLAPDDTAKGPGRAARRRAGAPGG